MLNLSLDSCVFFRMVKEYNVYRQYGIQGLIDKNRFDQERKDELEKELNDLLLDEYKKSTKGWRNSFIKKLDFYDEYITSELTRVKARMAKTAMAKRGYYEDENGRRFPKKPPTAEQEEQYARDEEYLELLQNLSSDSFKKAFIAKREEYKYLIETIDTNKILRKAIKGEVKLHIVSTAYKEINNHIEGKSNSDDPDHLLFKQEDVDALIGDLCTLVELGDKKSARAVLDISRKFRRPVQSSGGGRPMANDIDSIHLFGDARIMAESCLAGLSLVTLNVKDFIEFVGLREENDLIRQHIKEVVANDKRLSNALPFSQSEVLNGFADELTMQSNSLKLVDICANNQHFDEMAIL